MLLLDTSAIITLIEDEDGADEVARALESGTALVPWPVLLEVFYKARQEQGEAEADRRYAMLKHSGASIVWHLDEPILLTAGRLKAEHSLSFADALIAAYALRERATLMHKDPEFDALGETIPVARLPYKRKNKG